MLNIVVALNAEASAIVHYFQLKKDYRSTVFELFCNSKRKINLIVAGMGKANMAAAISYMHLFTSANESTAYLNLGIAGSAIFPVGSCLTANKIVDMATQKNYYPMVYLPHLMTHTVVSTFDKPQAEYPAAGVIDMEAAAFFQIATRFVTRELVQCCKIVSDCNIHDLQQLNREKVQTLIGDKITSFDSIFQLLSTLAENEVHYHNQNNIAIFQEVWHFTQSESNQLKQLLQRWRVLLEEDAFVFCKSSKTAPEVLQKLNERLQQLNYNW